MGFMYIFTGTSCEGQTQEVESSYGLGMLALPRLQGLKITDFSLSLSGIERLLQTDIQEPMWTVMGLPEDSAQDTRLMLLFSLGEGVDDFSYMLLRKRRNLVIAGGFVDELFELGSTQSCDDRCVSVCVGCYV